MKTYLQNEKVHDSMDPDENKDLKLAIVQRLES